MHKNRLVLYEAPLAHAVAYMPLPPNLEHTLQSAAPAELPRPTGSNSIPESLAVCRTIFLEVLHSPDSWRTTITRDLQEGVPEFIHKDNRNSEWAFLLKEPVTVTLADFRGSECDADNYMGAAGDTFQLVTMLPSQSAHDSLPVAALERRLRQHHS